MRNANKIPFTERLEILRECNPAFNSFKTEDLMNLKKGSFIKLSGTLHYVKAKFHYFYKKESWNELQLVDLNTGSIKYLEIEEDDYIECSITVEKLNFRDFDESFDLDLIMNDEDEYVTHNGIKYYFSDSYKVQFQKNSKSDKEDVSLIELVSDTELCLTIEEWGDRKENIDQDDFDYECYVSKNLNTDKIEIVAL